MASLSVAAALWGLLGLSHPGYWPFLAGTLVLTSLLVIVRSDKYTVRSRLTVIAMLAVVSLVAVAMQAPDITREFSVEGADASSMTRFVASPEGHLISSNLFPFGEFGPRRPFTYLFLALLSIAVALKWHYPLPATGYRRATTDGPPPTHCIALSYGQPPTGLIVGSGLISILLGIAAERLYPASTLYAPSAGWALRDPALAFAVLAGAGAAAVVAQPGRAALRWAGPITAALVLAALQGPAYAVRLAVTNMGDPVFARSSWTHDMTTPSERLAIRGFGRDERPSGERVALWPGTVETMREQRRPSTDFADAGYRLVTAKVKQRTMRGLIRPNETLFEQWVELPPEVLCDAGAVAFLRLRYLLAPPDVDCAPWRRLPGAFVDGSLEVRVAAEPDERVRALPAADLSSPIGRTPALSAGSPILPALTPLPGTSLRIDTQALTIGIDDPSVTSGQALVVPVAFDPAWRVSNGRLQNAGGLVAITDVGERQVTLRFVPDLVTVLRAASMTLAQLCAIVGFLGLAYFRPAAIDDHAIALVPEHTRDRVAGSWRRLLDVAAPALRHTPNWLYLAYTAAVTLHITLQPEDGTSTRLSTPLLLPLAALLVSRIAQAEMWRRAAGVTLFGLAVLRVASLGSLSAEALHDPLFWNVAAVLALAVSASTGRWPLAALIAAACAGGSVMAATLLSMAPNAGTVDFTAIGDSWPMLFEQMSAIGTACLVALCAHAIASSVRHGRNIGRVGATAAGALVVGVILTLAGALPQAGIDTGWLVGAGILLGLAEGPVVRAERRPSEDIL
jgi:hypothetical protein